MTINKYINIFRGFIQALFFEMGQEKNNVMKGGGDREKWKC
jgi:hypothetical protein